MLTIQLLKKAGYEAYLVGGCVRDLFLGKKPKDYDVATNATPAQMMAVFRKTTHKVIPTGIKHGTVTFMDPEYGPVEVTTYRLDGEYTDGRHPDNVVFTPSLEKDLARRDFTMNAIALDPDTNQTIDPFHGAADIAAKQIRAVGKPIDRFLEDPLRAFRAVRFAAQLGFAIEDRTWQDIEHLAQSYGDRIELVSVERRRDEMMKAMATDRAHDFWLTLSVTGLNHYLIPELDDLHNVEQPKKYHKFDVWEHSTETVYAIQGMTKDPIMRLTAMLHDVGKPATLGHKEDGTPTFHGHEDVGAVMAREILMRLRFSNNDIERVTNLIQHHLVPYEQSWSHAAVRRWVQKVGKENIPDLLTLREADLLAHGTDTHKRRMDLIDLKDRIARLKDKQELDVRLVVNGEDIMALGVPEGRKVGEILRALKEIVTIDPAQNTRERLLAYASEMK